MKTNFKLKEPSKESTSIFILVSFRGIKYKKYTGETVKTKYWNSEKKRARSVRDYPESIKLNDTLDKIDAAVIETICYFKGLQNAPDAPEFWEKFESIYYPDYGKEKEKKTLLVDYLTEYIEIVKNRLSPNTMKKYYSTLSRLKIYESEKKVSISLNDVDIKFYNSLQEWAYSKGYSSNYFGVFINVIKRVIHEASYNGICDKKGIEHKDFITINEDTDSVYLSIEELEKIHKLDFTASLIREKLYKNEDGTYQEISETNMQKKIKSLSLVRDRFLIGAYTGMRVSDYGDLGKMNFGEKNIVRKTIKTGASIVVPIHPNIRTILDRGFDPSEKVSDQNMNQHIKEVARIADITEDVLITKNRGGKEIEEIHSKDKLITTHTARRSFATNAYKAGVPTIAIMKITGHKRESTFLKYIKVSAEENAEILANHPFFGGNNKV